MKKIAMTGWIFAGTFLAMLAGVIHAFVSQILEEDR